jgi:hypothetical protein
MRQHIIVIAISAGLCGCGTLHSSSFLDATKTVVRAEPGHTVESGGLRTGSYPAVPSQAAPSVPYTFRVVLRRADQTTYRRMDRVKYDVTVKNVSDQPIMFPWSPTPINRRDRPAHGYRHAIFELIIARPANEDWVLDLFVLYGAPTVPGSLKRIEPGKSVTLRLPAVLTGSGFEDFRNPVLFPDPDSRLRVGMTVYAPDEKRFTDAHEEFSGNSVPITILAPPSHSR